MAAKQTFESGHLEAEDLTVLESAPRRYLAGALVIIAVVMLIGVSLFEWLAYAVRASVGVWASYVIPIIFSSILATVVAYLLLRKQGACLEDIDREKATYAKSEKALRKAHGDMERTVEESTGELVVMNEKLKGEIDERRRVEEELQKSKETYQNILESIEDGYYEVDLSGNFTFFNDAIPRLLGYTREELVGMNDRKYTNAVNAKRLFEAFNKVYTTGEPTKGFDWEVTRKNGRKRYVEASVSLIREATKGKPIGFRGIVRDVTERKRAEVALKKSEEKYRTILESIEDGYYEVDVAGNFTFFNDAIPKLMGYSREELMGMNNRQYSNGENSRKLYEAFNRVYTTGQPIKGFDWEIIRKDGTKRYVEASVSPIRDTKEGPPIGFRGIVRDVTERKETEKKIKQLLGSFGKMMT
ncbi:MAG: PAS domain S-box protein [Proteobacteria bacterium]|nr:PAS domain S-box protein [Pseudomonadota bacterium]